MNIENTLTEPPKNQRSGWYTFLIVIITIAVTAAITFWVVRTYIFPSQFKPVELSATEEQTLTAKLERLDTLQYRNTRGSAKAAKRRQAEAAAEPDALEPEAYTEADADRLGDAALDIQGRVVKRAFVAIKVCAEYLHFSADFCFFADEY